MSDKQKVPAIWSDVVEEMQGEIIYDATAEPIVDYCYECGHETGSHRPHAKECKCLNCQQGRWLARVTPGLFDYDDLKRPKFLDHINRTEGVKISIPRWSDLTPGG